MLYAFWDVDDVACIKSDGGLSPFLVDAFTADADEYLMCTVVDVPVVATARLEGDVGVTCYRLFAIGEVFGWIGAR